MKLSRFFVVVCASMIMCNVVTFASEQNTEQQKYVEKQFDIRNGRITFITKSEEHTSNCRCQPELEIIIKENKPGVLKNGDVIYFETSRYGETYTVNEHLNIESKGVYAEEQQINEQKDNHIAICISRNHTEELAEIKIHYNVYLKGNYDTDKIFSLKLDTDRTKRQNLFSGKQQMVLNENYLKILCDDKEKQTFPTLVFYTEKNLMLYNNEKKTLKYYVYINQKNTAMISIYDFIDIVENLGKMVVRQFDDGDVVISSMQNIYVISPKNQSVMKNGVLKEYDLIEKGENNVYYISLKTIADILGKQNAVVWNENTKTITIGNEK